MKYWFVCAEDANWIVAERGRNRAVERYYRESEGSSIFFVEEVFVGDLDLYTEVKRIGYEKMSA